MSFEERRPRRRSFALGGRFDAMRLQDVADGLVGHLVPDIGQGIGDPVVTPGRILASELQNPIDDFLRRCWPAHLSAFVAMVPFLGHEFPMPTQKGVRREERADRAQELTPQDLAFDGQATTLVVGDQDPFLAVLL